MPLLGGTTGLFRAAGGLLAGCVEGCCGAAPGPCCSHATPAQSSMFVFLSGLQQVSCCIFNGGGSFKSILANPNGGYRLYFARYNQFTGPGNQITDTCVFENGGAPNYRPLVSNTTTFFTDPLCSSLSGTQTSDQLFFLELNIKKYRNATTSAIERRVRLILYASGGINQTHFAALSVAPGCVTTLTNQLVCGSGGINGGISPNGTPYGPVLLLPAATGGVATIDWGPYSI